MSKKPKTMSKLAFILSVLGAAVGFGSIWSFPIKINQYGIVFLIPFLIALVICGLPLLFLEMNLGNKYRKNHVEVFGDLLGNKGKLFGFLQTVVVWMLANFYSVLVAWSLLALIMSFLPGLTQDKFFLSSIIKQTNANPQSLSQLGNFNWWIFVSLLIVWLLTIAILMGGVAKGVSLANKIFIPSLFFIIVGILIYIITLPGALSGINYMFQFHGDNLRQQNIWSDAFGQAFFMLSTCTGAIIIFSSHAPKNQNNTNQGLIIAFGTTIVALITTTLIFATMGHIATRNGNEIKSLFVEGPTFIFQVFTKIFKIIAVDTNSLLFSHFLAICFFLSVFFAGISSLIAAFEAAINPLITELNWSRKKALLIAASLSIIANIVFVFDNSSVLINGIATWVAGIWQMAIGIIELIVFVLVKNLYQEISQFNNKKSWLKQDQHFYKYCCLVLTPLIIFANVIAAIITFCTAVKSNSFVYLYFGFTVGFVGVIVITLVIYVIQQRKKNANIDY